MPAIYVDGRRMAAYSAAMDSFAGKVAVVTGAASGIGQAVARQLAAEGVRLVLGDVEEKNLAAVAAETGGTPVVADVASEDGVARLAEVCGDLFGHCDLLVSNAGVASTGRIADMTRADWDWLLGVNVHGFLNLFCAFRPLLEAAPGGGHIALTSSMSAFHVTPGMGGYTATKFAVTAIAETLALEHPGIGMTILCPGPVSTRLGSAQRNRHDGRGSGLVDVDLEAVGGGGLRWLDPGSVASLLLRGIAAKELYVFTHEEWEPTVAERTDAIHAAFSRMRGGE